MTRKPLMRIELWTQDRDMNTSVVLKKPAVPKDKTPNKNDQLEHRVCIEAT